MGQDSEEERCVESIRAERHATAGDEAAGTGSGGREWEGATIFVVRGPGCRGMCVEGGAGPP